MHLLKRSRFRFRVLTCYVVLFLSISTANCRRLSFKESLTALAEPADDESSSETQAQTKNVEKVKTVRTNFNTPIKSDNRAENQKGKVNNDMVHSGSEVYTQSIPAIPNKKPINPHSQWKTEKPVQHIQKIFIYDTQGVWRQHLIGTTPKAPSVDNHKHLRDLKSVTPISAESNIAPRSTTKQPKINNATIQSKQSSNNFFKTYEHNTNSSSMSGYGNWPISDQQRSKKEIASPSGMRSLVWNTATALWSVNKEHFLPTFLHTKTGGKLSLVRESLFKPITIISQFKNGVQEINNEKIRNLARLSRGGYGWGSSSSSPAPTSHHGWGWSSSVMKSQPNHFMTLARYIFRLTKHTTITKWRLKRALLDLQIRALRKVIRILQSNTFAQKVATVRILTGAAWKGKLAFLNFLQDFARGLRTTTTTPAPGPYSGNDNAVNVDITYSSLNNKYNHEQNWMSYLKPATPAPTSSPLNTYFTTPGYYNEVQQGYDTPAPSPTPIATYYTPSSHYNSIQQGYNTPAEPSPTPLSTYYTPAYYNAIQHSYETPPPPPAASDQAPSTVFVPPATPPPNMKVRQYLYQEPNLGSFSNPIVHFTAPVTAAKTSETLVEAPSYANALKVMGINPTNFSFNVADRSGFPTTTTTESSIPTTLIEPKPTMIYYDTTVQENKSNELTTNFGSTQNMNIVEEPTITYSYHSTDRVPSPSEINARQTSPMASSTPSFLTTGISNTTPSSSFRVKLLEMLLRSAGQV